MYLNGKKIAQKSAEKVFVFEVALEDGFNLIMAQAGTVKDTMTLEKVEKEPSIYVLPEVNERAEGVANWFQSVGNMDLTAPMDFPEGMYSIKDKIEDIANNQEAMDIVSKVIKLMMNMKVTPGEGMWDMVKTNSVEDLFKMLGTNTPDGFLESVNVKLTKIAK